MHNLSFSIAILFLTGTSFFAQAPAGAQPGTATPANGSLTDYVFTVPPGWTQKQFSDGIVLFGPESTGERCNLSLWPIRTASSNLQQDAVQAFRDIFKAYVPKDNMTRNSMIRGLSAQGWEYFMIKNGIVIPGGNYQQMFGFIFVARLGSRLAVISGISKDPLVSSCFGLNLTDVWPHFFYSLRFRNWNGSVTQQQLMQRLAGVWITATATAGDRWVFAPNGRYASAAAAQRYAMASPTEVLRITDAYFGNGAYSLAGAAITFTGDEDKSHPKQGWYRLEQESFDNGNTWADRFYFLRTSIVDGKEFEVGYSHPR